MRVAGVVVRITLGLLFLCTAGVTASAGLGYRLSSSGEIAYLTYSDGDNRISLMDVERRIVYHPPHPKIPFFSFSLVWSPNGSEFAFTGFQAEKGEIFLLDASGHNLRRVTANQRNELYPTWSPDGQQLAYVHRYSGGGIRYVSQITITNVYDHAANNRLHESVSDTSPVWSPDGRHIAYVSGRDRREEIYVVTLANGEAQRLTNNLDSDHAPTWSPDSQQIAFVSQRNANEEIYIMHADGSQQTRLTYNTTNDLNPVWSPDGTRIAFESWDNGQRDIYVINADGTNLRRLTDSQYDDSSPVWSPDSRFIAFVSARDGNAELYLMNADGTTQRRLTMNEGYDGLPRWRPNGVQTAAVSG